MSVLIWCEIVCADCSGGIAGQWASKVIPRRSLLKDAKEKKAVVDGSDVYCRSCNYRRQQAKGSKA